MSKKPVKKKKTIIIFADFKKNIIKKIKPDEKNEYCEYCECDPCDCNWGYE